MAIKKKTKAASPKKTVKKPAKKTAAPKAVKKSAAKKPVKKAVRKPAKKVAPKKAAPKKVVATKKTAPKKTAKKKSVVKKATLKKAPKKTAKKAVAKKAAKKAAPKKVAAKKTKVAPKVVKKIAVKKPTTKKIAAKKTPVQKPAVFEAEQPDLFTSIQRPVLAPGQKPTPEQLRDIALSILDERQATDIVVADLRGKNPMADFAIIGSVRSNRQATAIAEYLREAVLSAGLKLRIEGLPQGDWVLVDAGDVIVHVFREEVRRFYAIEDIWSGKAKRNRTPLPESAAPVSFGEDFDDEA